MPIAQEKPSSRPRRHVNERRQRIQRRFRIAFAALGTATMGITPVAHADPDFSEGLPDGGIHTFCYYSVSSMQSTMDAAMTRLRQQTVVDTAYYNPCDVHTDVRWVQGPTDVPAYGQTTCTLAWDNGRCDRYRVRLNKAVLDDAPHPSDQYRKTACHELGHSVGLSHYSGSDYPGTDTTHSCMRSGDVSGQDWNILYGAHHKGSSHISGTF
ncbi:MAG: hypothetical protein NTV23_10185 [Propionibacteriales bacterium]|nr:hypothetical protein [Propionibacteriales bacterium]